MFEDLIAQLDSFGVTYTEDYEMGTLTVDIASVDKSVLVDIIIALNDGGYVFSITEDSITVEGGEVATEEPVEEFDEEAYLDDAMFQA